MEDPTPFSEVLDSTQRSRWDEIFQMLPHNLRDINFSYSYNLLYEKNGDGTIRLFVYRETESLYIYPFLIRPVILQDKKSGFMDIETVYGYTGPITTSTNSDFLKKANASFLLYCEEQKIICEFVRFHPILRNFTLASINSTMKVIPLREYVYVDLQKTDDEIWDSYSAQNRNKIRKAEKLDVKIEVDSSNEAYTEFVRIYLWNMQQVNAAPMYFFSDSFFNSLEELVKESGVLLVARNHNEIVGCAVFLGGGEIGHYFLAAASDEGKKLAAGNLLLHHGIKWSKQNGMKKLHLGGGVSENDDDPLLVFKLNFSQQKEKFYIGKRIHDQENYSKVVKDWDLKHPEAAVKYNNILQRYRLRPTDPI